MPFSAPRGAHGARQEARGSCRCATVRPGCLSLLPFALCLLTSPGSPFLTRKPSIAREMDANVQQKLATLADRPGAYIFKDERGAVLYVGKAVSLRNRVRSYFQEGGGHSPRIRIMVPRVRDIDTIVTDS